MHTYTKLIQNNMKLLIISLLPQLVPLVFLILASISAPTLKSIYLAKDQHGTIYGIFGYCAEKTGCTPFSVHTSFSDVLPSSKLLAASTIDDLAPYLILAPIAAGLTFFSFLLNVFSIVFYTHLDSSVVYWTFSILLAVFAFLTTTVTCIFSFLIFYPHITWLSWCMIPAAVINLANVIFIVGTFKLLPSAHDILSEGEDDEDINMTSENFDSYNDYYERKNLAASYDIPDINMNKSSYVASLRNDESALSVNETDTEKNEPFSVAEKVQTQNSSSNLSLKVPSLVNVNPYAETETNLDYNGNTFSDDDNLTDNRLSDHESFSANSSTSNFTSISQRPINPNYYAGANARPRVPLGNNQQFMQGMSQNGYYNPVQSQASGLIAGPTYDRRYQQQYHPQNQQQQMQLNNYQNQMQGMPTQNRSGYLRKPKPYMMMGQRPQHQRPGYAGNMSAAPQNPYLNNTTYPSQYGRQPQNPYATSNQSMPLPNNGFVPMRHKNRNNMTNFPSSTMGGEGPYSGFR